MTREKANKKTENVEVAKQTKPQKKTLKLEKVVNKPQKTDRIRDRKIEGLNFFSLFLLKTNTA